MRALLVIFLLLTSCGSSNSMHVTKEVVPLEQLKDMCDDPNTCTAHSDWYEVEGYKYCTIYMLPYEMYAHNKSWYLTHHEQYLISYGHEMEHCEKGDWH